MLAEGEDVGGSGGRLARTQPASCLCGGNEFAQVQHHKSVWWNVTVGEEAHALSTVSAGDS